MAKPNRITKCFVGCFKAARDGCSRWLFKNYRRRFASIAISKENRVINKTFANNYGSSIRISKIVQVVIANIQIVQKRITTRKKNYLVSVAFSFSVYFSLKLITEFNTLFVTLNLHIYIYIYKM